ncbi:hypothetical protein QTG56_22815 (plasmid) [Rossellomorea sp. AcN35-11]|nr:hypothetical protein [Rossellomorea aquimaris]WJV32203.1 hypothetical protein QTG56_22815 [Rossellomorea sp. AcN35-11]
MNRTLSQDIEKEFLNGEHSQRIQESIMQQEEGTIEIFVRYGRHQKTSPPPVNLLGETGEGGLRYSSFKDMVHTISTTLKKCGRDIEFGYLFIEYKANEEGYLQELNLSFRDDIIHGNRPNKQYN